MLPNLGGFLTFIQSFGKTVFFLFVTRDVDEHISNDFTSGT